MLLLCGQLQSGRIIEQLNFCLSLASIKINVVGKVETLLQLVNLFVVLDIFLFFSLIRKTGKKKRKKRERRRKKIKMAFTIASFEW